MQKYKVHPKNTPPARHLAPGPAPSIPDRVVWTREVGLKAIQPRELYRIQYVDREGEVSTRDLELLRLGTLEGEAYMGVLHEGRFKTMRLSRILEVAQLSSGHPPSLRVFPTYAHQLPPWPIAGQPRLRIPTTKGNRTWLVDLTTYTCACPEKRERTALGYTPPQLGAICPHLARAILEQLQKKGAGWSPELLTFLADPRKVSIKNLT